MLTASGCGMHISAITALLDDDPAYRDKARPSELTRDIAEIVFDEWKRRGQVPYGLSPRAFQSSVQPSSMAS